MRPTLARLVALALLPFALLLVPRGAPPATEPSPAAGPALPLYFVANQGQWDTGARFMAEARTFAAWCHDDRLVLERTGEGRQVAVALRFQGGRTQPLAEQLLPGRVHFLVGDRDAWRSNVPTCVAVRYRELWPGIDLVVYDGDGQVEYDLQLQPGAELEQVAFQVEGADGADVDASGALVLRTTLGELRQNQPRTWEVRADGSRRPVECSFALRADGSYGFRVAGRSQGLAMVVDPVLVWGTYVGIPVGSSVGPALALDTSGRAYLGGQSAGAVPTTPGAYRTTNPGSSNGYVACLDPNLSGAAQLVWCTYLGGSLQDGVMSIAIGPAGEVVVGGWTESSNFPTTPGALDSFRQNDIAGFVASLTSSGSTLVFSTLIEGTGTTLSDQSQVDRVAVEADGKIVAAGRVATLGMPTTPTAYQPAHSGLGGAELWFGRLDPTQTGAAQLVWGTYYGGALATEVLQDIAIASSLPGVVTFTGTTNNAPFSPHDFTTGTLGSNDWLVGQLDSNLSGAAQRRFVHVVGGSSTVATDTPGGVAVAPNGEILVLGTHGVTNLHVARFSPNGASILSDRLLAGGSTITPVELLLSPTGSVVVTANTFLTTMPVTPDALQPTHGGGVDLWLCQLDPTLAQITYASYLGGTGNENHGFGGAQLSGNMLTLACRTQSAGMPLLNPHQASLHASGSDVHVMRLTLPSGGGTAPRDVELIDLDNDGDLDVATANETSDNVSLRSNNGAGVLGSESTVSLTPSDHGPVALVRCDLDNDGSRDDLAVVCETSGTLVLLTNPGSVAPTVVSLASGGTRASCVASGDLDGNPIDDLVLGCQGEPFAGGAGLFVVRNGGAAVGLPIPAPHPTQVVKVALGDLDGDGDLDLAALALGSSDEVLLFAGDGAGAFTFAGALPVASSGLANGLCLTDLDRDGRNDLVVAQPQLFPPSQTLRIWRRTSTGALAPGLFVAGSDVSTPGSFALDLSAGDLEDDSIPGFLARVDVAVANAGSGTVTIQHGFTGTAFSTTSSPSVGTNPVAVAIGDLNGDGCADVVVANQGSDDVTVLLTTPPALAQTYGTGCGGPTIAAVGLPTLGNAAFAVRVSNARPVSPVLMLFAPGAQDTPLLPSSCHLLLSNPILQFLVFSNGSGQATLTVGVPATPSLVGADVFFQGAAFHVPGGAFADTLDFSNALRVQVGQ